MQTLSKATVRTLFWRFGEAALAAIFLLMIVEEDESSKLLFFPKTFLLGQEETSDWSFFFRGTAVFFQGN